MLPERLAAAKLRGFVEDVGGEVVASEPGLIRVRVGLPAGYQEPAEKPAAAASCSAGSRPSAAAGRPAGRSRSRSNCSMEKPDPKPRLRVVVAFRPLKEYLPDNPPLARAVRGALHHAPPVSGWPELMPRGSVVTDRDADAGIPTGDVPLAVPSSGLVTDPHAVHFPAIPLRTAAGAP